MDKIRAVVFALLALCLLLAGQAQAVTTRNYVPSFTNSASLGFDGSTTTSVPFRAIMADDGSASWNYVQVPTSKSVTATAGSFYTPAYSTDTVLQTNARLYLVACRGAKATTITATLNDYDPLTGVSVLLDTATVSVNRQCSATTQYVLNFSSYTQKTIASGHRLKVTLSALQTTTNSDYVQIYDASSSGNSVLTLVEGAGSSIGNCLAAGTYTSSWGTLRTYGTDGKPRTDFSAGETINYQFGSFQNFASTSYNKGLFSGRLSASGTAQISSTTLSSSGTLYSYASNGLATQGAIYGFLRDSDSKPYARFFVNIVPEIDSLKFYKDAAYSVQTDTFAATDTVYAVLSSPSMSFTSTPTLRVYDFNNASSLVTVRDLVSKQGLMTFSFVPGTRLGNGDWGALYFVVKNQSGKNRVYHRNIRRLDSGCTYCSATAPYDLAKSSSTASSITLRWTADMANNTSYKVYRNGVLIASNVAAGSYTDNSLAQGTIYVYTVRGVSGACESGDSNPANAETLSNPGAFNARDCGTGNCGSSRADGSSPGTDNKIHTKVVGTAFDLEITATVSGFNGWSNVTADLWDASDRSGTLDPATNCYSTYRKITTTPATASMTAKSGKQTANFTVGSAYRDLVVKASFSGSPASSGCSLDHFAVRPASFTSASVTHGSWLTAGATPLNNTSATGGEIHRAGRPFTITASTGVSNYDGKPLMVIGSLLQPTGCVDCVAGTVDEGTWTASGGTVTTTTATYSEAGSFDMTLQDASYAAVDAMDGSTPAELTISSGTINVGRFVPDAYDLTGDGGVPTLQAACSSAAFLGHQMSFDAATLPGILATPVAYSGDPAAPIGAALQNLTGSLARTSSNLTATPSWSSVPAMTVVTVPSTQLPQSIAETDAANNSSIYQVTLKTTDTLAFSRPATPAGSAPFCLSGDAACALASKVTLSLDLAFKDTYSGFGDIVGSLSASGQKIDSTTVSPAGSPFYFGQLQMYHALGAGTVPLPVKAALQVWNGSAFSAFSGTCSSLSLAPSQVAMSFPDASKLAACDTRISMSSGLSSLSLSAPGGKKNGWVDLTWNLGAAATGTTCIGASASAATTANATWLQSGASYNANPTARARFGIRGNRRAVYLEAR